MSNKKPKPKKMWAVYTPFKTIHQVADTKRLAMSFAVYELEIDEATLLKSGYTVEKVTVTRGWGK
jgi:hypothetical protein